MEAIIPYLTFGGNAREAFAFYAGALNGAIVHMQTFGEVDPGVGVDDKDRVMHAVLKAGDLTLMTSDTRCSDKAPHPGDMISLSLNFTKENTINDTFTALSEGATIIMPLQDTFWNARFGILKDKFGIQWMFNHDKPGNETAHS
jgi:PhnB protein